MIGEKSLVTLATQRECPYPGDFFAAGNQQG
jgi:hypothetical protein